MTTQNFADFMVHIGAIMFGFVVAAIIMIVIYCAFRFIIYVFSSSDELEIVSTGKRAYIKVRSKKYPITNDNIPGIIDNGPGKITVKTSKNKQEMNSTGFDKGGMNFRQVNGKLYVNNTDISQLVDQLQRK